MPQRLTLRTLLLPVVLGGLSPAMGTHIVGGEMYYDHLGNNVYQITVKLYRDCSGIAFDDPIRIGVYTGNNVFQQFLTVPFPGGSNVPVFVDNPCLTLPPNLCLETASYVTTVNLPPIPGGYILSYQRCCRTGIITNLQNPADLGLTVVTRIPGPDLLPNSSPRFNELPPVAVCMNEPLVFDHSATDPDGDQLVYELCTPFNGGTSTNPNPIPSQATAPPYPFLPWAAGYSENYPIDSNPAIAIDPVTGLLTMTPTQLGYYTVGVCVSEYRNGVLIGVSRRDVLFNVVPCDADVNAGILSQLPSQICAGLTMNFTNTSVGGNTWFWDFGDPSTDQDVSTAQNPSWTYAQTGTYTVTLVANPGEVCADTATAVFLVYVPPVPFFEVPADLCGGSEVTLVAEGAFTEQATAAWNLGGGASPSSASGLVATAVFDPIGMHTVTLTMVQDGCTGSYTSSFFVHPIPVALFTEWPVSPQLAGTVVQFNDLSSGNGGVLSSWTWTVNGQVVSTAPNFTWENTLPGTYWVTLTVVTADGCEHSYTITYVINAGEIVIPNVFSPNADGSNDNFVIENAQYYRNTLTIYNRWGMVVYETANYRNNWQATGVPEGTYYYIFTLEDGREFTGHVTVLR
jgi:gliding motility-associated-like protein